MPTTKLKWNEEVRILPLRVYFIDGEIILNEAEMRKMVSIGAPVHELMHNILKRSLKEIDPTDPAGKRTRISADGKRIINVFLDRLPESEEKRA